MTRIHSGQRDPIRLGFDTIRLESSDCECTMSASYMENSVYSAYTLRRDIQYIHVHRSGSDPLAAAVPAPSGEPER